MPVHSLNNARLNIVESGNGSDTLVLLHGLLFSHRMFDAQVAQLQSRFRFPPATAHRPAEAAGLHGFVRAI